MHQGLSRFDINQEKESGRERKIEGGINRERERERGRERGREKEKERETERERERALHSL